jgi:hypothetical protein
MSGNEATLQNLREDPFWTVQEDQDEEEAPEDSRVFFEVMADCSPY